MWELFGLYKGLRNLNGDLNKHGWSWPLQSSTVIHLFLPLPVVLLYPPTSFGFSNCCHRLAYNWSIILQLKFVTNEKFDASWLGFPPFHLWFLPVFFTEIIAAVANDHKFGTYDNTNVWSVEACDRVAFDFQADSISRLCLIPHTEHLWPRNSFRERTHTLLLTLLFSEAQSNTKLVCWPEAM